MEAQIRISGRNEFEELAALGRWLNDDEELRGYVATVGSPIGETELGAVADTVTIALGSTGAGVALSRSIVTWLRTRRSDVKITLSSRDRTVELEATNLDLALPLLQEVLREGDGV